MFALRKGICTLNCCITRDATNRCDPGYEWGNVAAGEITQDGSAMKAFVC